MKELNEEQLNMLFQQIVSTHLTRSEIEEYYLQVASDILAARCQRHLATCGQCKGIYDEMAATLVPTTPEEDVHMIELMMDAVRPLIAERQKEVAALRAAAGPLNDFKRAISAGGKALTAFVSGWDAPISFAQAKPVAFADDRDSDDDDDEGREFFHLKFNSLDGENVGTPIKKSNGKGCYLQGEQGQKTFRVRFIYYKEKEEAARAEQLMLLKKKLRLRKGTFDEVRELRLEPYYENIVSDYWEIPIGEETAGDFRLVEE